MGGGGPLVPRLPRASGSGGQPTDQNNTRQDPISIMYVQEDLPDVYGGMVGVAWLRGGSNGQTKGWNRDLGWKTRRQTLLHQKLLVNYLLQRGIQLQNLRILVVVIWCGCGVE